MTVFNKTYHLSEQDFIQYQLNRDKQQFQLRRYAITALIPVLSIILLVILRVNVPLFLCVPIIAISVYMLVPYFQKWIVTKNVIAEDHDSKISYSFKIKEAGFEFGLNDAVNKTYDFVDIASLRSDSTHYYINLEDDTLIILPYRLFETLLQRQHVESCVVNKLMMGTEIELAPLHSSR